MGFVPPKRPATAPRSSMKPDCIVCRFVMIGGPWDGLDREVILHKGFLPLAIVKIGPPNGRAAIYGLATFEGRTFDYIFAGYDL